MKISRALTLTALTLALAAAEAGTAAASIEQAGVIPWGQPICNAAGRCETPTQGALADGSRWTFEWAPLTTAQLLQAPIRDARGVLVGVEVMPRFRRYHPNRSDDPFMILTRDVIHYMDATPPYVSTTSIEDFPDKNTVQCGHQMESGAIIGAGPGVEGNAALLRTCFPDAPVKVVPNLVPPSVVQPSKAAACAPVKVGKIRASVTSMGVGCTGARNLLARYMRTGAEPDGYVCSKLVAGKARSATCGTPARAAKRVTARWRG